MHPVLRAALDETAAGAMLADGLNAIAAQLADYA